MLILLNLDKKCIIMFVYWLVGWLVDNNNVQKCVFPSDPILWFLFWIALGPPV